MMISPQQLAHDLAHRKDVVWLTGAGLSAAAGIAPYRATNDAVWSRFATEWGTFKKLKENPELWRREFWHKTLPANIAEIEPTKGHHAINHFVQNYGHTVITQNIDGLHEKAGTLGDQLIEAHGHHSKFVCFTDNCSKIVHHQNGDCNVCGGVRRPLVLLFDEEYTSHPAYQYELAEKRLRDAEIVIFVGTSLSVGITSLAQFYGSRLGRRMINLNLAVAEGFENIIGPCDDTLTQLASIYVP